MWENLTGKKREIQGSARAAHPGGEAADAHATTDAGGAPGVGGAGGGLGEHRAAGSVEVAGAQVDQIDQPTGQRAKALGGGADAAVDHRRLGVGELRRQRADLVWAHPRADGDRLGGERRQRGDGLVEADGPLPSVARIDPTGSRQFGDDRCEQQRIGPGADGQVGIGCPRRLGAARVDHHHPAATIAYGGQPARPVGCRGQAAVGLQRVGPHEPHQAGAVDIGHRHRQGGTEHQPGGHLLGALVNRAGREYLGLSEAPDQRLGEQGAVQVVHVGVTQVDRHAVAPVRVDRSAQQLLSEVPCLLYTSPSPRDRTRSRMPSSA